MATATFQRSHRPSRPFLTAGLKALKYQENWINYRTTCQTLRKEKHFYDAELNDYRGAKDKEAVFVERVESLISRDCHQCRSALIKGTRDRRKKQGSEARSADLGGPIDAGFLYPIRARPTCGTFLSRDKHSCLS